MLSSTISSSRTSSLLEDTYDSAAVCYSRVFCALRLLLGILSSSSLACVVSLIVSPAATPETLFEVV